VGKTLRTITEAAKILRTSYQKLGVKGVLVVSIGLVMVYVLDEEWPRV
jgi:hypothetical protein